MSVYLSCRAGAEQGRAGRPGKTTQTVAAGRAGKGKYSKIILKEKKIPKMKKPNKE